MSDAPFGLKACRRCSALAKQRFRAQPVLRGKGLARFAPGDLGPAQRDPRVQFVQRLGIDILAAQFLGSICAQPREAFVGLHGTYC